MSRSPKNKSSEYLIIEYDDNRLQVLDSKTYKIAIDTFFGCGYAISEDRSTIAISEYNDKKVTISSFPSFKNEGTFSFLVDEVDRLYCIHKMALSSDGKLLAMVYPESKIGIFETRSGSMIDFYSAGSRAVWDLSFSPDENYLASVDLDGTLFVRDIKNRTKKFSFDNDGVQISDVEFSPNGEKIAVGGAQEPYIHFFDTESGKNIADYPKNGRSIRSGNLNSLIITNAYNAVQLSWELGDETGFYANCVYSPDHENFIETDLSDAALSSDEKRVALVCGYLDDNTNGYVILVRDLITDEIYFKSDYFLEKTPKIYYIP